MKIYFFRGSVPNFGDELNLWLLPKIFPNFFDDDDSKIFLGIGSVLLDTHPKNSQKIVFGSGYGGYTPLPVFDEKWKFYCVRGPLTAKACNLNPEKVAGDSAILINKHRPLRTGPTCGVSFMPHWESVARGHWEEACKAAGIKFIDPRSSVETVLNAIETSSTVITEAMHGAIVADALRVPWIPVLPIHHSHRMKWFDWAQALDLSLQHHKAWPSSVREAWVARKGNVEGQGFANLKGIAKAGLQILDWGFIRFAATRLSQLAKMPAMQSSDSALNRVIDKLENNAAQIKRDFPKD